MNYGLYILIGTYLILYNMYYDGYLVKTFKSNKKYIEMSGVAFIGLSLYVFMKKHPKDSSSLLKHASGLVKHIPIDKNSKDLLLPVFDFTRKRVNEENKPYIQSNDSIMSMSSSNGITGELNGTRVKRSVSESRKKYVASQQNWTCNHCRNQLDATFEVDHVKELQDGGTNDVSNLVALCRNCHGKKTLMNRLNK